MKNLYCILLFSLFLGCYENDGDIAYRPGIQPTILFFGDSRSTFGGTWDQLPNEVYNAGRAGSTLDYTVSRLYLIDELHPDVVIIFTGVNDATKNRLDAFMYELAIIIDYAKSRNVELIIMDITVMPSYRDDPNYFDQFAPFRDAMERTGYYYPVEYTDSDFINVVHLNSDGYETISNAIINFLDQTSKN